MAETTEKKVSGAILQEKKMVTIGGVDYEIAPPSAAVWIKASEFASESKIGKLNDKDVIAEIFKNVKYYKTVCKIAAVMITGVKNPVKYPALSIFKQKSDIDTLAEKLINAAPSEVKQALNILFIHHEAGFFFGNITFLHDITTTQPTKTEATVSGQ